MSHVVTKHMVRKITDTHYLQSYFEEKYDSWFTASIKDRERIEDCVCQFVEHNLDDSIYVRANNGLASGLCSYPHFEDGLIKIISLLKEINNSAR